MMDVEKVMAAEVRRNLVANDRPRVPPGLDLYWKWFADLTRFRRWSMAGPDPIQFQEIEAYGRLTGWEIRPKDVQVLIAMDEAYVAYFRDKQSGKTQAARPLSAALFDAAFG